MTFHVLALGSGRPVLMLHGFPESRWSFRHNAPALAAAGFRVYVPDLKGYGLTDKPKPGTPLGDYRPSVLSAEIAELILALGYQHMDIVGHDWGGLILGSMMITARHRIDRAVLVNAPLRRFVPWRPRHIYFFNLPSLPERRFWRAPEAFVTEIFDHWTAPKNRHGISPDEITRYVREFQRGGSISCALAYYRALRHDLPFISRAMLSPPKDVPQSLVLFGAEDPIMPEIVARWAHADLPGSELVLVPGAGHFVQSESPERFNREVLRFLGAA